MLATCDLSPIAEMQLHLTSKFGSYSDLLNSHTSTKKLSLDETAAYLWKLEFLPFVKPEVWTLPIARIFPG